MRKQQGVGLIEVLVATLVLAIGLFGIAGLHTSGLKNNKSSYHRTQASYLAMDILDRMRANQAAAANGDYDHDGSTPSTPAELCTSTATQCTSQQMATADVYDWSTSIASTLPDGSGVVSRDAINPNLVTVTVRWNDDRAETAGDTCGTNLLCLSITTDL